MKLEPDQGALSVGQTYTNQCTFKVTIIWTVLKRRKAKPNSTPKRLQQNKYTPQEIENKNRLTPYS